MQEPDLQMWRVVMRVLLKVLVACVVVMASAGAVWADIPQELAWQGVVLDSNNIPLSDGVYNFHFRIFADDVGGSPLWTESQAVTVHSGVLNVLLGKLSPIPDSVFGGPARFLEVQFESQVPYVPRTRVVSVGYAYRTASVDGALSGELSGDLDVQGNVAATGFSVIPPPGGLDAVGGPSVDIQLDPQGGLVKLNDELAQVLVFAGPDADGEGGQISVASNPAGTTGILLEGNSSGSGEPHLAIVGSQSALNFDLKPGGEISLILPPGTVTSDQIKDESGVASGVQPGAIVDIEDTYRSLASATATFPSDGYVVVISEATMRGGATESWIDGRLREDGTNAAHWFWDAGDLDKWYDQRQTYTHAQAVDSGTHTFELQLRQPRGKVDAVDARVTLIFVPTAYGLIATSTPLSESVGPDSSQTNPGAVSGINVQAEQTASVAFNTARIQAELDEMSVRVAELQAELAQARSLPASKP